MPMNALAHKMLNARIKLGNWSS